jgi:hypothetical protein
MGASHALRDCQQYLSYTSLFDAYKFDEISCTLTWLPNVAATSTTTMVAPTFWFYPDQDDATPPPTVGTIMGKQGLKCFQPGSSNRSVTYKFKPKMSYIASTPPLGTGMGPVCMPATWIDCVNPDLFHYGSKIFLQDMSGPDATLNPNMQNAVRIQWSYRISFRSPIKAN